MVIRFDPADTNNQQIYCGNKSSYVTSMIVYAQVGRDLGDTLLWSLQTAEKAFHSNLSSIEWPKSEHVELQCLNIPDYKGKPEGISQGEVVSLFYKPLTIYFLLQYTQTSQCHQPLRLPGTRLTAMRRRGRGDGIPGRNPLPLTRGLMKVNILS